MLSLLTLFISYGMADVGLTAESPWSPAINSTVYTNIERPLLGEQQTLQRQIVLSRIWTTQSTFLTTATPTVGYSLGALRTALQLPTLFQVSPSNDAFKRSHLTQATIDVKYLLPMSLPSAITLQVSAPLNEETHSIGGTRYRVLGTTEHTVQEHTLTLNGGYQYISTTGSRNNYNGLFAGMGTASPLIVNRLGITSEVLTQYRTEQLQLQWGLGTYVRGANQTVHLAFQKTLRDSLPETMDWNLSVTVRHTPNGMKDLDNDGIPDNTDLCLTDPEDQDGYHDWDGCPEANLSLPISETVSTMELDRGIAVETFQSAGFGTLKNNTSKLRMDVSENFDKEVLDSVETKNLPVMGSLQLIALNEEDEEIPHATWTIDSEVGMPHKTAGVVVPLLAGEHPIIVRASGYRPYKETISIIDDSVHIVHLKMIEHTVDTNLKLPDKIYFDTGSANISQRSHTLLDEVSEILNHHTTIQVVEIEGHTDNQGSETNNLRLSQQRADAVRAYLVAHGVAPERVIAKGYGPTQPIADNATQDGRHLNRRVVFTIQKRQQTE